MRAIYMGTPSFAVPPLSRLVEEGYQVVGVYTQQDRPAGRGRGVASSPVKAYAQERGLPVFQPASLRSAKAQQELSSLNPDVIVIAAYGRILPSEVLRLAKWGCVNIHPSLLPRHRGPSPVAFTLLEGDEVAGVSLMLLDEGMDSGPMIAQEEEEILPQDNVATLTDRLFRKGAALLVKTLPLYCQGQILPRLQDESRATYARKLTKEDGIIQWELPALSLWRQMRAYSPWPGSYTYWRGRVLKVLEAEPIQSVESYTPGTVVALTGTGVTSLGVATGEGVLRLNRVQLEGKKALDAVDFLRGYGEFLGSVLPS